LATVITGSGSLAGPVSANEFRFNAGPWLDLATSVDEFIPYIDQTSQAVLGPSQLNYSGKLTVLLVGSDHREGSGERLDTILIMSINPSNKVITAASIPRDTARIPIPPEYGGGTYKGKINGMFKFFKNQVGGERGLALKRFERMVEYVLQINIDYTAYMRFGGFDALVDEVSGVPTAIPYELRDDSYIDKPGDAAGAKFLASSNALLKGGNAPRCVGGYPKPTQNWNAVPNCTRALVYVRSRHGKLVGCCGNNDYKRAGRQQKFVYDAIKRVTNGFTSSKANALASKANSMPNDFWTDIPTGGSSPVEMYNLLKNSTFSGNTTHSAVFSPKAYAQHIAGTSSNQLKLDVVRTKCNSLFD